MKHSTDRILTTHVGSLPRPPELIAMVRAKLRGEAVDDAGRTRRGCAMPSAASCANRSSSASTSLTTASSASRASSPTATSGSAASRRAGTAAAISPWAQSREALAFPEFYQTRWAAFVAATRGSSAPARSLHRAGGAQDRPRESEGGARRCRRRRGLHAGGLAGERRGLSRQRVLQDGRGVSWSRSARRCARSTRRSSTRASCSRSTTRASSRYYILEPDMSVDGRAAMGELASRRSNHALRGIPTRPHPAITPATASTWGRASTTCELKDLVDIVLKIRADAYSFEAANPRHEHEWTVWADTKLPDGQDPDPGRDHAFDGAGRASRAGRASGIERFARHRRARERHRGHRLRLCDIRAARTRSTRASCGPSSRRWCRARESRARSCGGSSLPLHLSPLAGRGRPAEGGAGEGTLDHAPAAHPAQCFALRHPLPASRGEGKEA